MRNGHVIMTTMLERAARAAALANEDEGCFDPVSAYTPIARAVLMAVREEMIDEKNGKAFNRSSAATIDAILNGDA